MTELGIAIASMHPTALAGYLLFLGAVHVFGWVLILRK